MDRILLSLRTLIICLILIILIIINVSLTGVRVGRQVSSNLPSNGDNNDHLQLVNPTWALTDSVPLVAPVPARRRRQRLPTCLIIGVRKGGTRALLDALAIHPFVRVARREIHFFNNNSIYAKGIDWYRTQMPYSHSEQVTIEKTPAYFTNLLSAQRIHQMDPSIKIILILRNPVTRTISDFTQVVYTKIERNKTQPQFETEAFLNDSDSLNINYKPIRNSLYALHMQEWLKYFSLNNFLLIDGDTFIRDPLSELRKVERFLRVPNQINADQVVFNSQKGFYCFRRRDRRKAKCLGETKGRAHVSLSAGIQAKLHRLFQPHNKAFYRMVNHWWNW